MKEKIEKLIRQYIDEATDTEDEFSHGDAMARMSAYVRVTRDLKDIIKEENRKERTMAMNKDLTEIRLTCPSCKSGFLTMKTKKGQIGTFNKYNVIPYCECCKKRFLVTINQEEISIKIKPLLGD